MKLIIEIPNIAYQYIKENLRTLDVVEELFKAAKNGKSLPDSTTNGDMLLEVMKSKKDCIYPVGDQEMGIKVDVAWWKAPYKIKD